MGDITSMFEESRRHSHWCGLAYSHCSLFQILWVGWEDEIINGLIAITRGGLGNCVQSHPQHSIPLHCTALFTLLVLPILRERASRYANQNKYFHCVSQVLFSMSY